MADKKIVELPALTVILPDDLLAVVDIHDPTDDPTGSLKQITVVNLLTGTAQLAAANTFTVAPQTVISDDDAHAARITKLHSATQTAPWDSWQNAAGAPELEFYFRKQSLFWVPYGGTGNDISYPEVSAGVQPPNDFRMIFLAADHIVCGDLTTGFWLDLADGSPRAYLTPDNYSEYQFTSSTEENVFYYAFGCTGPDAGLTPGTCFYVKRYYENISTGDSIFAYIILPSGVMGINVDSPDVSAQLDVTSTTRGFLPPRGTTTQKNAIVAPAEALVFYDTTLHAPYFWNGSAWTAFAGAGSTYSADEVSLHLSGTTFSIKSGYLGTAAFVATTAFDAAGAAATALTTAEGYTDSQLAAFIGTTSVITLGTVTTGTWHGTIIGTAYGGTGVDNSTGGTANQFWARPDNATGAATYRLLLPRDRPRVVTADADGSTITMDWAVSEMHTTTLTASRTIAFSNPLVGGKLVIRFASNGTGPWTPVWPAGIKWQGGAAPILTAANNHYDEVAIRCWGTGDYDGFIGPNCF